MDEKQRDKKRRQHEAEEKKGQPKVSFKGGPGKGEKLPEDIRREAAKKKADTFTGQIQASWKARRFRIWGNKPR